MFGKRMRFVALALVLPSFAMSCGVADARNVPVSRSTSVSTGQHTPAPSEMSVPTDAAPESGQESRSATGSVPTPTIDLSRPVTSTQLVDHCGDPASVPFPFTPLVEGAAQGGTDSDSTLHLVDSTTQRQAVAAKLDVVHRPILDSVDLTETLVVAAFLGLKPSSGYAIHICSLEMSNDMLVVTVQSTAPSPEALVRQGFESPYDLVQVARAAFDTPFPIPYQLRDTTGIVLDQSMIP